MRMPTRTWLILLFSLLPAAPSAVAQAPDSLTEIGAGGGFRARMPGGATVTRDSTVVAPGVVVRRVRWTSPLDHPTYRVEMREFPAGSLTRFTHSHILQVEVDEFLSVTKGTVKEHRPVTLGTHRGRRFAFTGTGTELTGRMFVVGNRIYTIYVLYVPSIGASHLHAFLDSFEFVER